MGENWADVGAADELTQPVQSATVGGTRLAITYRNGQHGAISAECNHAGGPLDEGTLDGDYVVCPWHFWKFHAATGVGEAGYEADRVPAFAVRVESGRVLVDLDSVTKRQKSPHPPHPLARNVVREPGPIRVLGLSTTVMTAGHPRYSTSDALLEHAIDHIGQTCDAKIIRLRDLSFRHCEGFYSKSARACTWPCSITQMDPTDELDQVYEALVHWADVYLITTPIRWGSASSLYFKMVERMNCIQNQETIANRTMLRNKAAGFIITGGQDNVQGVAGQMLGFFAELGVQFPQFPYVAHSRGWTAEDMENNVRLVSQSEELREGARLLVERCVQMAELMVHGDLPAHAHGRGGRKGHKLKVVKGEAAR